MKPAVASYWLSCKKMTVITKVDEDNIIIFTANATKKFLDQPLINLENWFSKLGGFKKVQLHQSKQKMSFETLFQIQTEKPIPAIATPKKAKKTSSTAQLAKARQLGPRGCEHCPLDKVDGVNKILPVIDPTKQLMIIAQSPGPDENAAGTELIGRSGKFFWNELAKVGIQREHVNVFNAVKCWPVDVVKGTYSDQYKMRDPSKEEIHCCSIHSEKALEEAGSQYILITGQVAAKAILKTRSLPSQKIFYSPEMHATIYLIDHPAFFIRGGITNETKSSQHPKLASMRSTLELLKKDMDSGRTDRKDSFTYLKEQKYYWINSLKNAVKAGDYLLKKAQQGQRLSVDIENYVDENGKTVITHCGFSPQPGTSFVFLWEKPEVVEVAKTLLCDSEIKKAMQYGCSDVTKLRDQGVDVQGYDFDTMIGEYFSDPDQKKYGLDEIAELHFPEFSGYKYMTYPDILKASDDVPPSVLAGNTKVQESFIRRKKLWDIRKMSAETIRLYNGADCDVTKRAELRTANAAPLALMQLYIDLGFVLYQMESNGPLFDYEHHQKIAIIFPHRAVTAMKELREMAGDENFNPNSPKQVHAIIYGKLGLEFPGEGKVNTRKETMLVLSRQHAFPGKLLQTRRAVKAKGTYVEGFLKCANHWGGRLRTRWKSTGTATGRLSSGKGKDDAENLVNLQNIHNEPLIKNMCVADTRWRDVFYAVEQIIQPWLKAKETLYAYLARVDKKFDGKEETIKARRDKYERLKHFKTYSKAIDKAYQKACQQAEQWVRDNMDDLYTFIGLDYGQIEVRVVAQVSGDKQLIQDCLESDIHTTVGVTMTGWSPDQIRNDKKIRTLTKNIHFGIIFGQSEDGTVNYVRAVTPPEDLEKISEEMIREGFRRYHARYPGIRRLIDKQRAIAKEHKFVETIFGLRRPLIIEENSRNTAEDVIDVDEDEDEFFEEETSGKRKSYWGNICINSRIQGSAHQLMICAIVNLLRQAEKYKVLGVPSLEVHDFLGFRVRVLDLIEAYKQSRYLLEHESLNTVKKDFPHIKWRVPIVTEAEAGFRLGCQVGLEEGFSIGDWLIRWFLKAKKQEVELDKELKTIQAEAIAC